MDGSGLAFFGTDRRQSLRSDIGYQSGVMLRGRGAGKPEFAYGIVHIHSLAIYSELTEYKNFGDTKAPLLHCFLFVSKPKIEDNITTSS